VSRLKIAFVGSGGAARGLAHLGVLKACEELGVHPEIYVGASAGALVSATYGQDIPLDVLLDGYRLPWRRRHSGPRLHVSTFLDLDYDRGNRWSAPARYGVYGFGYRRGVVAGKALAWADFFDLVQRYPLQGISFLPGPVQPVSAALAALDEDTNTDDDGTLERAQALLLAARPGVNTFSGGVVGNANASFALASATF